MKLYLTTVLQTANHKSLMQPLKMLLRQACCSKMMKDGVICLSSAASLLTRQFSFQVWFRKKTNSYHDEKGIRRFSIEDMAGLVCSNKTLLHIISNE